MRAGARRISEAREGAIKDERARPKVPAQAGAGHVTTQHKAVASIYDQELSPSYQTMPISLAASSQTQIGSSPFSNFRQRLSQSIIGTKQLKVEETDSGLPFFIQTRNRA
jgi:hypothetical protein